MKNVPAPFVALLAVVLLVVLAWAVLSVGADDGSDLPVHLPVIAIFAIAAMFAVVTFLVAMFKEAGLTVTTQPLGLPDGSVRALIALSLIIIFAVLTLYVLTGLSDTKGASEGLALLIAGQPTPTPSPTPDATPSPDATPVAETATSPVPSPVPSPAASPVKSEGRSAPAPRATPSPTSAKSSGDRAIEVIAARQQSAQDLAKQLLTMLGTLLTAVSSFYFGSASTKGQTTQLPSKPDAKPDDVKA